MSISKISLSSFCLAFVMLFSVQNSQAKVHIEFQTNYYGQHQFNVEIARPWVENIETLSEGRITAKFYEDGEFLPQVQVPEALVNRKLDMASTALSFTPNLYPLASSSAVPFLTNDAIQATKFIQTLYAESPEVRRELDKIGKVLNLWGSDIFAFYSKHTNITSPKDINGKKVLVWYPKQAEQLEAWGAIPILIEPAQTENALKNNMANILYAPLLAGIPYKAIDHAKFITPIPSTTLFLVTWISWNTWKKFTIPEQELIIKTTKDWGTQTGENLAKLSKSDIDDMKRAGCVIYKLKDSEIYEFKSVDKEHTLKVVREEFTKHGVKKDAKQWIDYIYRLAYRVQG